MDGATVKNDTVDRTFQQAAVERYFCFTFGKKFSMPDLHAVGKLAGQAIQKLPQGRQIARAERGGKLEPVLPNPVRQWRHARKELFG